jgi:hypothetical protein
LLDDIKVGAIVRLDAYTYFVSRMENGVRSHLFDLGIADLL